MADAAISALTEGETLRVWSFIVTLFGDLARAPGASLSGAMLTALTGRVGIKPASMRVALHRLRKDGWLASERTGRTSRYFLTEHGRRETLAATRRIYAHEPPRGDLWHLRIARPGTRLPAGSPAGSPAASPASAPASAPASPPTGTDSMTLLPGVRLGIGPAPAQDDCLTLTGKLGPLPDWLREAVIGAALREDYARFEARLERAASLLPERISDLDRAVLRGLIVHGWRRLLLRHPDLPDDFLGPDCRIGPCRARVMELLDRLGPVAAADLLEAPDGTAT